MGMSSPGSFMMDVSVEPMLCLVNAALVEESEEQDADNVTGIPERTHGFCRKTVSPQQKRTKQFGLEVQGEMTTTTRARDTRYRPPKPRTLNNMGTLTAEWRYHG
ncbi:hypothetical protein OUZ56_027490 [Daphnia magna]|uniref:Uncharacterized protein n=1 Tax=Daphnia magna TaxID=35525 RepID=A0ABQ9ZPX3_9CRUS|nr:hypothetical protein OUZ56_027490 [Daphnia magna]